MGDQQLNFSGFVQLNNGETKTTFEHWLDTTFKEEYQQKHSTVFDENYRYRYSDGPDVAYDYYYTVDGMKFDVKAEPERYVKELENLIKEKIFSDSYLRNTVQFIEVENCIPGNFYIENRILHFQSYWHDIKINNFDFDKVENIKIEARHRYDKDDWHEIGEIDKNEKATIFEKAFERNLHEITLEHDPSSSLYYRIDFTPALYEFYQSSKQDFLLEKTNERYIKGFDIDMKQQLQVENPLSREKDKKSQRKQSYEMER